MTDKKKQGGPAYAPLPPRYYIFGDYDVWDKVQMLKYADDTHELRVRNLQAAPKAASAIGDELRDTLVAVSAAIAEQDDRTAQKMLREILAASPTPPAEQQAQPGAVYAELPQPDSWFHFTAQFWENKLRDFADRTHALRMQAATKAAPAWADQAVIEYRYTGGTHWCPLGPAERMKPDFDGVYRLQVGVYPVEQAAPKAAPGVGNSGFDHQTAADFLNGKTVSDESVRKFVQASRWAHDEKASLSAMLLSVRGELASREAEIALLKKALMEAEAAPQQEHASPIRVGWGRDYQDNGKPIDASAAPVPNLALAPQQEAREPVAWLSTDSIGERYLCFTKPNDSDPVRPLVFGDTTPQPAPAPLSDAIKHYLEAQDALDNREYAGINAESYEKLIRCRNASRKDLDAALAAQGGIK